MSKNEKMKLVRSERQEKFNFMRERGKNELKTPNDLVSTLIGHMGPIKTFGELSESILKLRENFDAMLGKT